MDNFYKKWTLYDKFENLKFYRYISKLFINFNFVKVFVMIQKGVFLHVEMSIKEDFSIKTQFSTVIAWVKVEAELSLYLFYFLIEMIIVFYNLNFIDFLYHIVESVEH